MAEMVRRRAAVRVFEVGPRDGLQNEPRSLPVEKKLEFIRRLVASGVKDIEIGSFVHPVWVPQMADTDELVRRLPEAPGVRYWALVPNRRGLERAFEAGIRHISVLVSATETHNLKNLNRTLADGLRENVALAREALAAGAGLRGYCSVAFGCPYEGAVPFDRVLDIADRLLEMGVWEVSLGDTTGVAQPDQVRAAARRALDRYGAERIAFHFHDTRGLGLTNAWAVLEEGAATLDSSTGGIGGCPYAPGAAGNLPTEDLVHLLDRVGVRSGIDLDAIVGVARWLRDDAGLRISARYFQYAVANE